MDLRQAKLALRKPISDYFEAVRSAERPREGLAALIRPALQAMEKLSARNKLRDEMRKTVRSLHIEFAKESTGGDFTFNQSVMVGARIEKELSYMEAFLREVGSMSEKAALNRASKYATSAFQSGSESLIAKLHLVLPILPGDRSLRCNGYCVCHLKATEYRDGDVDVYWVLGEAEHCPDCVELAARWNPLKIRRWSMQ